MSRRQTPLSLPPAFLIGCYCVIVAVSGAGYYNWPPFAALLYGAGAFRWVCNDNLAPVPDWPPQSTSLSSLAPACLSQELCLVSVYSWGFVASQVSGVVSGAILDFGGPRVTAVLGLALGAIGWYGLGLAHEGLRVHRAAIIAVGLSASLNGLPGNWISSLYPHNKALILTMISASFDASLAVPVTLLFVRRALGLGFRQLMRSYAVCILAPSAILSLFLFPAGRVVMTPTEPKSSKSPVATNSSEGGASAPLKPPFSDDAAAAEYYMLTDTEHGANDENQHPQQGRRPGFFLERLPQTAPPSSGGGLLPSYACTAWGSSAAVGTSVGECVLLPPPRPPPIESAGGGSCTCEKEWPASHSSRRCDDLGDGSSHHRKLLLQPPASESCVEMSWLPKRRQRREALRKAPFKLQLISAEFYYFVLYFIFSSLRNTFFSVAARQMSGPDLADFIGFLSPLACIPCYGFGFVVHRMGLLRCAYLLNALGLLMYLTVIALPVNRSNALFGAVLYVVTSSFTYGQLVVYVADTFGLRYFGLFMGIAGLCDGTTALLNTPLYDIALRLPSCGFWWAGVFFAFATAVNFIPLCLVQQRLGLDSISSATKAPPPVS